MSAISADNEGAFQLAPVPQPESDSFRIETQVLAFGGREYRDVLATVEGSPHCLLQHAVLDGPRKLRHAGAIRVEADFGARAIAEYAHGVYRGKPILRQRLPRAHVLQKSNISRAQGVHACIERGRSGCLRCTTIIPDHADR